MYKSIASVGLGIEKYKMLHCEQVVISLSQKYPFVPGSKQRNIQVTKIPGKNTDIWERQRQRYLGKTQPYFAIQDTSTFYHLSVI